MMRYEPCWPLAPVPDWRAKRDKSLIRVMLDTGMRRGEAVALNLDDLDLGLGVIHVRISKTRRERLVPLGIKARADLRAWLRARAAYLQRRGLADDGTLFVGRAGEAWTGSGLFQAIERRMVRAGVDKARAVHVLRHTFATRALESGAHELDVQAIGGWATLGMLSRYVASTQTERAMAGHRRWSPGDRI